MNLNLNDIFTKATRNQVRFGPVDFRTEPFNCIGKSFFSSFSIVDHHCVLRPETGQYETWEETAVPF